MTTKTQEISRNICHARVSKQTSIVAYGKLVQNLASITDTSKVLWGILVTLLTIKRLEPAFLVAGLRLGGRAQQDAESGR